MSSASRSTSVRRRLESPASLRTATTATGSVAENIAPKSMHCGQVQSCGNDTLTSAAVIPAPRSTPGPARSSEEGSRRRTTCHSSAKAPANSRMGRKPARRRFGSMPSQSLAPAGSRGHVEAKVSRATPRRTPQIYKEKKCLVFLVCVCVCVRVRVRVCVCVCV